MFSWMRSLVLYLILSGVCINLSPGKNYKRYISFFSGIVVIIILSEPIYYIAHIGNGDISKITDEMDGYLSYNSSLNVTDSMYDYYDMSIKRAVEIALMNEGIDYKEISVIYNDYDSSAKIYVYIADKKDEKYSDDEIKNIINEVYNADLSSIYVIRR